LSTSSRIARRGEKDVKPFMEKKRPQPPDAHRPQDGRRPGTRPIRWIPVTLVVDREGMVVGRAIGPREWDGKEALDS